MNWNNLENGCCPKCGKKLSFRLRKSSTKIRARDYNPVPLQDDYYFCFPCDFIISAGKFNLLNQKYCKIPQKGEYLSI